MKRTRLHCVNNKKAHSNRAQNWKRNRIWKRRVKTSSCQVKKHNANLFGIKLKNEDPKSNLFVSVRLHPSYETNNWVIRLASPYIWANDFHHVESHQNENVWPCDGSVCEYLQCFNLLFERKRYSGFPGGTIYRYRKRNLPKVLDSTNLGLRHALTQPSLLPVLSDSLFSTFSWTTSRIHKALIWIKTNLGARIPPSS